MPTSLIIIIFQKVDLPFFLLHSGRFFCLYISSTTLIILFRGNRTGEQIKENKIKDIQHQINEIKQKTRKEYSYLKDLSN